MQFLLRATTTVGRKPQRLASHNSWLTRFPCGPPIRTLSTSAKEQQVPVVIVGGGPSGLLMANLLQQYQVDFVLLEALTTEERFFHPQAHFMNTRTMEILRHFVPAVYDRVVETMPPVEEWDRFLFGPYMTAPQPMAVVQHPVRQPLVANRNANGRLLQGTQESTEAPESNPMDINLSDCGVGHLAQHTFNRILYEEAMRTANTTDSEVTQPIQFGTRVVNMAQEKDTGIWTVTTDQGQVYRAPRVVAADGVKSQLRQQQGIDMHGEPAIQHLINVHFTVHDPNQQITPAMLYTVFSPKVLAMVVRHSADDYVMQIPYFPPYQEVDQDFQLHQVQEMVQAALRGITQSSLKDTSEISFDILSIRPWTMGSLVAESYARNNVYLVGDAAHVFPPAGGFGMNTGMQDVTGLAWRLKLASSQTDSDDAIRQRELDYTRERQAAARNNAALSVRNYQRVLGVMKTCYLDHEHPTVVMAGLEASSRFLPGVPQSWTQWTFRGLLQTALSPLRLLQVDNPVSATRNPYAKLLTQNIQKLLRSGQGLPLLFPNHEVAFQYPSNDKAATKPTNNDTDLESLWSADTWANTPELKVGSLFPHLPVHVIGSSEEPLNLCRLESDNDASMITTRDLPVQLATSSRPCTFCVLHIAYNKGQKDVPAPPHLDIDELCDRLESKLSVPVAGARLWITETDHASAGASSETGKRMLLTMSMAADEWQLYQILGDDSVLPDAGVVVVIRPDGHVASIGAGESTEELLREFSSDCATSRL